MLKRILPFICLCATLAWFPARAQQNLHIGLTPEEIALIPAYRDSRSAASTGITTPPTFSVRTMAEWEEIQTIVITWTQYQSTLREIVRYAKEEVVVLIVCADSNAVISYLSSYGIDKTNVRFIQDSYDSIWMRDYGGNTIYANDVDSLLLVDWIYNRPRPDDDILPEAVASYMNIPIYSTTVAPYDLVHTGGNFMSDGFGTAFSSNLVLDENGSGGQYNQTIKTEAEVDSIMYKFMGIDNYIKMTVLPYDVIHHIDMHMKLLDEETILIGEYPGGDADGPQIEANLQYVLNNFNSMFGTPYKILRIEMPPDGSGKYPDDGPSWNTGDYRTFTNSVFINKTILVPIYEEQYDTTALRIYRENLPGYKVIGIDCNSIIQAGGALHCITRAIGVDDPLLISHQPLKDVTVPVLSYQVDALVKHRSGISSADVYYTTDTTQAYQSVAMTSTNGTDWTGYIPEQLMGSTVYYYIDGTSNSGKQQVRPLTAPSGYWDFDILGGGIIGTSEFNPVIEIDRVFPNPASAITCISLSAPVAMYGSIKLLNVLGEEVRYIYKGKIPQGEPKFFLNASDLNAGSYFIEISTDRGKRVQKLMVK